MKPQVGVTLCSINPLGGGRCWSELDPPHSCPYPQIALGQRDKPSTGAISMGVEFFFSFTYFLLIMEMIGPCPLPPPVLSLPHLSVLQTPPPPACSSLHPIVGEPPHYVFKVNGFRCEHHVLTVAL